MKYFVLIAVLFVAAVAVAHGQTTLPIVNRPLTIRPAQYVFYQFTVPSGAANATIQGRFEASGGNGNDVEVYVMDQDAFVNWQNGHKVSVFYSSGRMTQANVRASLPGEGNYYLVFSNRFSLVANKAVMTEINLLYE